MNALTKNERQAVTRRPLEGQRALVTGANSGIGEAVARGFADAGARVVVNYVAGEERGLDHGEETRIRRARDRDR